tara:strand:- start:963 stop:3608 length:2646 start_codon:yes stop_codon:yes gene_type:complete
MLFVKSKKQHIKKGYVSFQIMPAKRKSVLILSILLFSLISNVQASNDFDTVPQFGTGFEEVVIADSSDDLFDPRDLEFHPGRANELWIANRGDDSITIVHNTGLDDQYSENRQDSNHNHFLEEVSAIAFGAYHPEFDWQWGSAQETQNTYCGALETPNLFMGPTLWPSSLDHYAVENQNNGNGLLGSHIDMNHQSPDGMGIAHDNGNAYWYFDGYYGELVYYDFQVDHDTGQDDHSDGIVHRYSDVKLTRDAGIPGHMILDKDSGILYIADTGASRVLWVNTDSSVNTIDIMDDPSRMEPLAEYKRKTGVEWGVIDTGLNRPSGIALEGGMLFVSENGNGQITAYDLADDGKSATIADTIQTSAVFIMGLEIGPDGHLYYVDNGQNQVVRIDPYFDSDADGVYDEDDNCPTNYNPDQANYDGDNLGDICDEDDDNDLILDENDVCPMGETGWISRSLTDFDGDGCRDESEDLDDDDDAICDSDVVDLSCQISSMSSDLCPASSIDFTSNLQTDNDADGCEDTTEDDDDDNDGYSDDVDDCQFEIGTSSNGLKGCIDTDYDGYADSIDVFPSDISQWLDTDGDGYGDEKSGTQGDFCPTIFGTSTSDRLGCIDSDGDSWSDPDESWTVNFGGDAFPDEQSQHFDSDGDGFGNNPDGYQPDSCPNVFGTSFVDRFGCIDTDGDGWSDAVDVFNDDNTQWADSDGDGYGDALDGNLPDSCPEIFGNSTIERYGCLDSDGDGLDDELDAFPFDSTETIDSDGDGVGDNLDAYPLDSTKTVVESTDDESSEIINIAIIGGTILALIIVIGLYARRRKSNIAIHQKNQTIMMEPIFGLEPVVIQQQNVIPQAQPPMPQSPPLPPEGLPPGWTMEQWNWYGEDYLRNQ